MEKSTYVRLDTSTNHQWFLKKLLLTNPGEHHIDSSIRSGTPGLCIASVKYGQTQEKPGRKCGSHECYWWDLRCGFLWFSRRKRWLTSKRSGVCGHMSDHQLEFLWLHINWANGHGSDCRWSYAYNFQFHQPLGIPQNPKVVQTANISPKTVCSVHCCGYVLVCSRVSCLLPTFLFQIPVKDIQSLSLRYHAYLGWKLLQFSSVPCLNSDFKKI